MTNEGVEKRMEKIEGIVERIDKTVERMDERLTTALDKLDDHEDRIRCVESKQQSPEKLECLDDRVRAIETKGGKWLEDIIKMILAAGIGSIITMIANR